MHDDDDLITCDEARRMLGVGPSGLSWMLANGTVRRIERMQGRRRIVRLSRSEVMRLIDARRAAGLRRWREDTARSA